jgi:peptidoglycan/LPS O-acetylase OafA/YrhL
LGIQQQNNEQKLGALTALRFIAAFLVVIGHTRHDFLPLNDFPEQLIFNQAVTFFFVLSGFILTYVYPQLPNFNATKSFLVKRIARLWPLHISAFFLDKILVTPALVTVGGTAPKLLVALTNVLMLHAWIPFAQFFFSYNAPSWSISAEFFFYLCFPMLLMAIRRHFWMPIIVSFSVICLFIHICNINHLTEDAAGWNMEGLLYINPVVRIFEFITGMMTAHLFARIRPAILKAGKGLATVIEIIAFALAIGFMFASLPIANAAQPFVGDAGVFWLKNSIVPLAAFNFLILVTAFGKGLISKFLSLPPMVLLGDISYAVYLVHYPLLMYRRCYLPQENTLYSLIAFLVVLLIISHLLFVIVERPIRHLITTVVLHDNHGLEPSAKPGPLSFTRQTAKAVAADTKYVFQGLRTQVFAFFRTAHKRAIFIVELLCLVCMVLVLHPAIDRMNSSEVLKLLSIDKYLAKEISVGDDLTISRVVSHRNENSEEVELLFRAKKKQNLDYYLFVQLLNAKGEKIYEQQVNFSPLPTKVRAGDYWLQSIQIPVKELRKAESIGMIVLKEKHGFMPISGGKTDMEDYRLLMSAKSLGKRRTGEPML